MGNNDVIKLLWKGGMLLVSLAFTFFYPDFLTDLFTYNLSFFRVFHLFWLIVVLILIKRFIPRLNPRVSLGKIYKRNYLEAGEDSATKRERLKNYIRKMNTGAIWTAIYWIVLVAIIGVLYNLKHLSRLELFIVVIFFIFMDQFCISIWCPFKWLIKNKCCNSCRINNWGYLMAFSPLVFIPSFWTYSVLSLSIVAIAQWEYLFYKYPERFYELYNANLMCKNCKVKCKKLLSHK